MAAKQQFEKFRAEVTKKLREPNQFNNALGQVESKTGVDRFFMVSAVVILIALYMTFGHFAELVCNLVGFVYPAYQSIKAVESSNKADDTQWLIYWIVFAAFNVLEFGEEHVVGWFPIYWLVKCAILVYLYLPSTMGAQKIYVRFFRPFVSRFFQSGGVSSSVNKLADEVRDNINEAARKVQ